MRIFVMVASIFVSLTLAGCASRPVNEPIEQVDMKSGYRPFLIIPKRQNNERETLFLLSFSGGGTRAAALSYGVLEELRRIKIVVDGQSRRLIDEVDIMTGVSGGSFTALSYALYGERLFSEYEQRFLKRNVQGDLAKRIMNPFKWYKYMGGTAGRSEVAAEYYDEILFEGATFGDLLDRPGPVAIATATDISTGSRLAFFQNDFDLLCTDLNDFRLARAASASSAVPVVLSAVTLTNYGDNCGFKYPPWVTEINNPDSAQRPSGRVVQRYKEMQSFQDSDNRPFIHLVDGGVSDNIGVRGVMEALEELAASAAFRGETGFGQIRQIVLIVVNAHSSPGTDWDRKEKPPGIFSQLMQSSSVPIERYSFETIEQLKDRAEIMRWRRELMVARTRLAGASLEEAEAAIPELTLQVVDDTFDAIKDPVERAYFMELPTSFVLEEEQVDHLRKVAGKIMRESGEFQAVVSKMGGTLSQ